MPSATTSQDHRRAVADKAAALTIDIVKHERFVASPGFCDLHGREQVLLRAQLEAMRTLHFALCYRLHFWQQEEAADARANYGGTD